MKKTIQIDLDGVLNTYCGNYSEKIIPCAKEGAKDFLQDLSSDYNIEIFTVRNKKMAVKWLEENNMLEYINDVTNVKNPYTSVFVDDRALNFSGDFNKTKNDIRAFCPYWEINK